MSDLNSDLKRQFTITCDPKGGVEITDGNKKKGGNLKAHPGKAVTWKNSTTRGTCYLEFTRLLGDEDEGEQVRIWPFEQTEPDGMLLKLDEGGSATVTLALERGNVTKPRYVEYRVLGSDKEEPLVDPVIIIDPN